MLKNKVIAVIGYGSQGRSQALNFRDSGLNVIVGQRPGKSYDSAVKDNFEVYSVEEAVKKADIIHILLPDESMKEIYEKQIEPNLSESKTISFSHGFNITYNQIIPQKNIDVIMITPFSNGSETRESYFEKGVPGLFAVHQDYTRNAKETAKELAKAAKFQPLYEFSFEQETTQDLYFEQTVLCGGIIELIKKSSEVFIEAGYPEELAYYGAMFELQHVIKFLNKSGISKFNELISNTAEFGEYITGPKVIADKKIFEEALKNIESGAFTKQLLEEANNDFPIIKENRNRNNQHPLEIIGKELRKKLS